MAAERLFADVLQECHAAKKTGALFVSVSVESENLIRIYFKDGEIVHVSYGPVKDKECTDILDCYDLKKAVFFNDSKAPVAASGLPKTADIIAMFRKSGKKVQMD